MDLTSGRDKTSTKSRFTPYVSPSYYLHSPSVSLPTPRSSSELFHREMSSLDLKKSCVSRDPNPKVDLEQEESIQQALHRHKNWTSIGISYPLRKDRFTILAEGITPLHLVISPRLSTDFVDSSSRRRSGHLLQYELHGLLNMVN